MLSSFDPNNAVVGGTIKLFDLCLRFCFFDLDVDCVGTGAVAVVDVVVVGGSNNDDPIDD